MVRALESSTNTDFPKLGPAKSRIVDNSEVSSAFIIRESLCHRLRILAYYLTPRHHKPELVTPKGRPNLASLDSAAFRGGGRREQYLWFDRCEFLVQIHWRDPSSPRPLYSPRPPPSPAVNGGIFFWFGAPNNPTLRAHAAFLTQFSKPKLTPLNRRRRWGTGRNRGPVDPV